MPKLRVRDLINGGWIDIRNAEFKVRSADDSAWVDIYPGNVLVRNATNTDWIYIDSAREGDELDCPEDTTAPTDCNGSFTDTVMGSGDGFGSGGPNYNYETGWPPGYDLPDASGSFFYLQEQRLGITGVCLRRPGLNTCESYEAGGNMGLSGGGLWNRTNTIQAATFSTGARITETVYTLPVSMGTITIPYNIYNNKASIDVYYLDRRVATTCGQVTGPGVLAFDFYPETIEIGAAKSVETRIMLRVRTNLESTKWAYQVLPARTNPSLDYTSDEYYGTVANPYVCNATVNADVSRKSIQYATDSFHTLGDTAGVVYLDYYTYAAADRIDVLYQGKPVATVEHPNSGPGTLIWYYDPEHEPNVKDVCVRVVSPISLGITVWKYTIYCPGSKGSRSNEWPCGVIYNASGHPQLDVHVSLGTAPSADPALTLEWDMGDAADAVQVFTRDYGTRIAKTDGAVSGPGTLTIDYDPAVHGTDLVVSVSGPLVTSWEWVLYCPGSHTPPEPPPPEEEIPSFPVPRAITWNDYVAGLLGFGVTLGAAPSDGQTYTKEIMHALTVDEPDGSFLFGWVATGKCSIRFQVYNGENVVVDTTVVPVNGLVMNNAIFDYRRSILTSRYLKVIVTVTTQAGQPYQWGYSFSDRKALTHDFNVPPYVAGWIVESLPSITDYRSNYGLLAPVGDPSVGTSPYNLTPSTAHNSLRGVWYDSYGDGTDASKDDYLIYYGSGTTYSELFTYVTNTAQMNALRWRISGSDNKANLRIQSSPPKWKLMISSEIAAYCVNQVNDTYYKLLPRKMQLCRDRYIFPQQTSVAATYLSSKHTPLNIRRILTPGGTADFLPFPATLYYTISLGETSGTVYFAGMGFFHETQFTVIYGGTKFQNTVSGTYVYDDLDLLHYGSFAFTGATGIDAKAVVQVKITDSIYINSSESDEQKLIEFVACLSKPLPGPNDTDAATFACVTRQETLVAGTSQEYTFALSGEVGEYIFLMKAGPGNIYMAEVMDMSNNTITSGTCRVAGTNVKLKFDWPGGTRVKVRITAVTIGATPGGPNDKVEFTFSNCLKCFNVDPYDIGPDNGPTGYFGRQMECIYLTSC